MIIEFIGGPLNGHQMRIDRYTDYINHNNELYYAHVINYKALGWTYVWYQFAGMAKESESFV